jgi:Ca-activated chloride channel family protein
MSHVQLQCKLARNYTMEGLDKSLAYLLIKAVPEAAAGFGQLPLNVALVLDVSGSMHGEKLECAKEAACLAVECLLGQDSLSLVVFNHKAKVIIPRRRVEDKNGFFSRIREIKADGGTCMFSGMEAAIGELGEASTATINRMLLFTDGETEGEGKCLKYAQQATQNKLVISTFGIGNEYNEELLREISRVTLGGAYHLQHPEQMKDQFTTELKNAAAVGITNVNLTFQLTNGVSLEEVHRIVPNIAKLDMQAIDERTSYAEIGGLDTTGATCFGATLTLPVRQAGRVRIANVVLRYDIPSAQIAENAEKCGVVVEYTKDRDLCGKIDREVMGYFDQLLAQELVEQASKAAQAGNVADATQKLIQARTLTERIGNVAITQHIQQAVDELNRMGAISAGAQKTIRLGSTHTVRIKIEE